jgi:uncharacterized membrane protein YecN with MAPEG domain
MYTLHFLNVSSINHSCRNVRSCDFFREGSWIPWITFSTWSWCYLFPLKKHSPVLTARPVWYITVRSTSKNRDTQFVNVLTVNLCFGRICHYMTSSKADSEVSRFPFLQLMRLLNKTWILTVLASSFLYMNSFHSSRGYVPRREWRRIGFSACY